MKGIMVTLLTFLMTGIVVGQQDSSFSGQFGPRNETPQQTELGATGNRAPGGSPQTNPFAAKANTSSQIDPNFVRPMEVPVSPDLLNALKAGKELQAPISASDPISGVTRGPEYVSGISLTTSENEDKQLQRHRVWAQPQRRGSDKEALVVKLSSNDLLALENRRLSLDIPESERGRYSKVYFSYDNPAAAASPTPDNRGAFGGSVAGNNRSTNFNSRPTDFSSRPTDFNSRQTTFNDGSQTERPSPLVQNPGPVEPGEVDFMGPFLPEAEIARNRAQKTWDPPQRQNVQNTPQWDRFANQGNQTNPAVDPLRNQSGLGGYDYDAARERSRKELAAKKEQERRDEQNAREQEQQAFLAQGRENQRILERRRQEELDAAQKRLATLQYRQPRQNERQESSQWPSRNQRSDNSAQINSQPTGRLTYDEQMTLWNAENLRREKEANERAMAKEIADRDDEIAYLRYQNSLRTQPVNNVNQGRSEITPPSGYAWQGSGQRNNPMQQTFNGYADNGQHRRATGRIAGTVVGPVVEQQQPPRNRLASLDTDGIADRDIVLGKGNEKLTTSIAGPNGIPTNSEFSDDQGNNATQVDENKSARLIYFLLLCSLGLNVYLALISRSFYVRYSELADELRETFTATS